MLQSFKKSMLAIIIAVAIASLPLLANGRGTNHNYTDENCTNDMEHNGYLAGDLQLDDEDYMPPPPHGDFFGGEMEHKRKRIHEVKNKKMVSLLELEGDTKDKVLELTNKFDESKFNLMREMRLTTEELKISLKRDPASKNSTELANKLCDLQKQMPTLHENYKKEMKSLITAKQYNLFIYFDTVFEREVVKKMRERQNRHDGGGGRGRR